MPILKVTGCKLEATSIRVYFSADVDVSNSPPDAKSALNLSNYIVFAPASGLTSTNSLAGTNWAASAENNHTISLAAPIGFAFEPGEFVHVTVQNVAAQDPTVTSISSQSVSGKVPGEVSAQRTTRDVEDAISYPILTEEVAYRPSPVGIATTGAGGVAGPGGSNLGQVALQAVSDVLGWKANPTDPKGFIGALTQSFTLADVEGHVEATWKPRTYAVQTDLGGGITGAQASLYMRAKDALDQSLTLIDGLYPLDPEADPEYVKALRGMARSQMTEIVKELGVVGLPSILRINTYFSILLGQDAASLTAGDVQLDPDQIGGTLGELRDQYGIEFVGNEFNNSVEDEQDITNFRVISDYMTSLLQSWIANREFFLLKPKVPAFFGTQLVLLSRQFNVIAETVNELRFALDSVFIGPNERQTLLLEFDDHTLPPMFLEDVLDEVDSFVTDEGPRLLRDGGKISVTNNILPVVKSLERMIKQAHHPKDQKRRVPDGFRTARVRHALDDLEKQLRDLRDLASQVEQEVPAPEGKPIINSVSFSQEGDFPDKVTLNLIIRGEQFDSAAAVDIFSTATAGLTLDFTVVNSEEIDVSFVLTDGSDLEVGNHDVVVTNPGGQTSRLQDAFSWDGESITPATRSTSSRKRAQRQTAYSVAGAPVGSSGSSPSTPTQQQVAGLQKKYDGLQRGLNDLKTSHNALSNKVDELQLNIQKTLANHLAETKSTHEVFIQEVRGWWEKIKVSDESGKKSKSNK